MMNFAQEGIRTLCELQNLSLELHLTATK
jgi:hypothetical protein